MTKRILIIGGTGVFGRRIALHLKTFDGIEVFVSSRSFARAEKVVGMLNAGSARNMFHPIALNHGKNLAQTLATLKPFAVIDCSGPFQSADYTSAKAILKAGAHLIDLADARGYLAGFTAHLDANARDHGVTALTGASSTPALSSCVVAHLTDGWQQVDSIDICITPGGKSEVGRSVIEAILSYAGRDIPVWKDGQITRTTGWADARTVLIPQLGQRRVAAVETFDAEYLGPRHNVRQRVSFAAGLESRIEQRGIETLAVLRKRGLAPDPSFLIPTLLRARKITRIPTSDQGGMLVVCEGQDAQGMPVHAEWSLVAKNDHGPFIPILPAAAALKQLLIKAVPFGASIADCALTLDAILAQMSPYDIVTRTDLRQAQRAHVPAPRSLAGRSGSRSPAPRPNRC